MSLRKQLIAEEDDVMETLSSKAVHPSVVPTSCSNRLLISLTHKVFIDACSVYLYQGLAPQAWGGAWGGGSGPLGFKLWPGLHVVEWREEGGE